MYLRRARLASLVCSAAAMFGRVCHATEDVIYNEPEYVHALTGSDFAKLANSQPYDWDLEIRAKPAPPDALDRQSQSDLDQYRTTLFRLNKRRAQVVRSMYVFAFAYGIEQTCTFFGNDTKLVIKQTLEQTQAASEARFAQAKTDYERNEAPVQAARYLMLAIGTGVLDARSFLKFRSCDDDLTRTVISNLRALTTPPSKTSPTSEQVASASARYVGPRGPIDALAEATTGKSLLRIPPIGNQVEGVVIGWSTDLKATLAAAKSDGLPVLLILTFSLDQCAWCNEQFEQILRSREFNRIAGRVHAISLVKDDSPKSEGTIMYNALNMTGAPAMSLLSISPAGDMKELIRLNGYHTAQELIGKLSPLIAVQSPSQAGSQNTLDKSVYQKPEYCWPVETIHQCNNRLDFVR